MFRDPDETILLVEDDSDFVDDLLALWRPTRAVHRAVSAGEAVDYLRRNAPVVVLLDLCLSTDEEDGLDLLAHIRERWGAELPVVVVTRSTSDEARGRAMHLGVSAYLGKPVEVGELDQVVRRVLSSAGESV